jgi:GT2 family glycosyltransferase
VYQAIRENRDVILVNADIQFINNTWLEALQETDASVVGALLTYSNGLVQHAGIYFSILRREHDHRYRMAPSTLSEVHKEIECPVTGALMYIKSECLQEVGYLDNDFGMGWEDVDYCIRVMKSGRKCMYQPKAIAIHHESMFRRGKETQAQRWFEEGLIYLQKKYAGEDMSEYCPTMIEWQNG